MRIEPGPRTSLPLFADSRSPASSFVDMVSDARRPTGDDSPPQSALGFQALGMFGRQHAVGNADRAASRAVTAPVPSSRSGIDQPDPGSPVQIESAGPATTVPPVEKLVQGSPVQMTLEQATRETAPNGMPEADGATVVFTSGPEPGDETPVSTSSWPPDSRRNPQRPELQMRVALFNNGSGVAVTVTAPHLSACDIQRFRERAETVLRNHGILLDKVAVNGEDRLRVDTSRGSLEQWR